MSTQPNYQEGSPWFWKIFGGSICGLIFLLLVGHINFIHSALDRVRVENENASRELKTEIIIGRQAADSNKEKLVALETTVQLLKEEIKLIREEAKLMREKAIREEVKKTKL